MSDDGKDLGPARGTISPEAREALHKRSATLGEKLDAVKARKAPPPEDQARRGSAMGQAFKISAELIAGVAVGGGIGWALDRMLGTAPWLFITFLVLGFAAGMLNVIRTARKMQAEAEPLQRAAPSVKDGDEDEK